MRAALLLTARAVAAAGVLSGGFTLGVTAARCDKTAAEARAVSPGAALAAAAAAAPPPAAPPPRCPLGAGDKACKLLTDADLRELSTGRSVLLVCRGHKPQDQLTARARLHDAMETLRKKHPHVAGTLRFYVIDETCNKALTDTLLTRLGIYHDKPFIMMCVHMHAG